jgi:hypothetical protein
VDKLKAHSSHALLWPMKTVGKNVTVYIQGETATKMEELKEVNWSQVCKSAIETYIEARKSVNPAARLKLDKMKQAEQKDGYLFGAELAKDILDKLSYDEVHKLRWDELNETWDEYAEGDDLVSDWLMGTVLGKRMITKESQKKRRQEFDEWASKKGSFGWVLALAEQRKSFRKNSQFYMGMLKGLREVLA